MAKFTWLVNREKGGAQDQREKRCPRLGPKPFGVDKYREGLGALQRSGWPEACSRPRTPGGGKAGEPRAVTRDQSIK